MMVGFLLVLTVMRFVIYGLMLIAVKLFRVISSGMYYNIITTKEDYNVKENRYKKNT